MNATKQMIQMDDEDISKAASTVKAAAASHITANIAKYNVCYELHSTANWDL